ncbi:MAG: hypothetical protein JXB18_10000 [Sedimentisphaerales bacterium]|nr:hypothetical protein [Sedimentisphaerales bacterium]
MKNLLVFALLGALATVAVAADQLTTTVDVGWYSKYLWRGFDLMDNKAVVTPSIDFDFGNGFNFNIWSAQPGSSGGNSFSTVNATEFDYTLSYKNIIWEDGCLRTDYKVGYRFYDFTDMASNDADMQELFMELAWPNMMGNGFTPRYAYYHMWNSEGNGLVRKASGPIHALGLDYVWTFEQAPELPMKLSADLVYNDGTGNGTVDHDWSHVVWGLSTSIEALGGKITPGVWYQNSMEDTVNTEDELWSGISYSISF